LEEKIYNAFKRSEKGLDDLKFVLGESSDAFVDQVTREIAQVKNEIKTGKLSISEDHPELKNIITTQFKSLIKNWFLSKSELHQFDFYFSNDSLSIDAWERLLGLVPHFLECARGLPFSGNVAIEIKSGKMYLQGHLENFNPDEESRKKIYYFTRELLKKNAILTYKIKESSKLVGADLGLVLDFSHSEIEFLKLKGFDLEGAGIFITRAFSSYITDTRTVGDLKDHFCLEITKDLELKRLNRIPQEFLQSDFEGVGEKVIFHFPFLFRPLSIIIPEGMELVQAPKMQNGNDTGSETRGSLGHEAFSKPSKDSRNFYLDFFQFACS